MEFQAGPRKKTRRWPVRNGPCICGIFGAVCVGRLGPAARARLDPMGALLFVVEAAGRERSRTRLPAARAMGQKRARGKKLNKKTPALVLKNTRTKNQTRPLRSKRREGRAKAAAACCWSAEAPGHGKPHRCPMIQFAKLLISTNTQCQHSLLLLMRLPQLIMGNPGPMCDAMQIRRCPSQLQGSVRMSLFFVRIRLLLRRQQMPADPSYCATMQTTPRPEMKKFRRRRHLSVFTNVSISTSHRAKLAAAGPANRRGQNMCSIVPRKKLRTRQELFLWIQPLRLRTLGNRFDPVRPKNTRPCSQSSIVSDRRARVRVHLHTWCR